MKACTTYTSPPAVQLQAVAGSAFALVGAVGTPGPLPGNSEVAGCVAVVGAFAADCAHVHAAESSLGDLGVPPDSWGVLGPSLGVLGDPGERSDFQGDLGGLVGSSALLGDLEDLWGTHDDSQGGLGDPGGRQEGLLGDRGGSESARVGSRTPHFALQLDRVVTLQMNATCDIQQCRLKRNGCDS